MNYYLIVDSSTNIVIEWFQRNVSLEGVNTRADAAVNSKPFIVEVTPVDPPHDPATQTRTGPVAAYDSATDTGSLVWTVRAKTPAELGKVADGVELADLSDRILDLLVEHTIGGADNSVAMTRYKALRTQRRP